MLMSAGWLPLVCCCLRRFHSPDQVAFLARCVRRFDPITELVLPEAAALCSLIIQVGACRARGIWACVCAALSSVLPLSCQSRQDMFGVGCSLTTCCPPCVPQQAGLARFPNNPTILLVYANYVIHVKKEPRAARQQLQLAGKCDPDVIERYNLFAANVSMARMLGCCRGKRMVVVLHVSVKHSGLCLWQ